MSDYIPTCKTRYSDGSYPCRGQMNEIGETGKTVQIGETDEGGLWEQVGVRSAMLYQCPDCKIIKIN